MAPRFDSFILLAEMRTGSNFLEENLNQIPGLRCWGEAFNPHFIGHAGKTEMAGVTMAEREADPAALLAAMRAQTDGLAGFRFFHDHDPRVLELALKDRKCAKIVLNRNPLESFVSLQIARQTNQWRLSDMKNAKHAAITFDADAFRTHLDEVRGFQLQLMHALQTSGQTAFHIGYEDVGDIDVLNGLARWLGIDGRIEALSEKTKVQNPAPLSEKVINYDEMVAALGDIDHFALGRTPNFEPRRGPNIPTYLVAAKAPLLFMPLKGGPTDAVAAWLAALDGADAEALGRGMTQKDLRKWKRTHPGHRSFTVLRHPVARAHAVFCRHILVPGPDCLDDIREMLRTHYKLPIPAERIPEDWGADAHRAAFLAYLDFVKGNLGGQTSLRVAPAWATQATLVQGMGQFILPDRLLREDELPSALPALAELVGVEPPDYIPSEQGTPLPLGAILNDAVTQAVRDVYKRDYMMFGFEDPA
ncbi:nodulation protein NodH [Maribius pontilimi]|uniref:Nodulation protein NodH n=1 Tax=Palleronia pontilimi TaxID=1964209 RepID=A0A934IDQ8_9RHOB|nr:nodulation protein NodH [Palleronia pontilimi]MBJ3761605.1 nodulation protein NodH [Palleronia pontilimi]